MIAVAMPCMSLAQMPGAPVLQNAWASPGIVIAGNFAGGSGSSVFAGAAGWAPASGRFQLSGGGGMQSVKGGSSRGVYGARIALPVMQLMGGRLGVAAFAGIGGGAGKTGDTTSSTSVIPGGVTVGYRQPIGSSGRGFSVYVDPSYQHHTGGNGSQGYFRVAAGVDAGLSSRFGLTVGVESGAGADAGKVGPSGTLYGVGISMKLGR
ncbi:MAG TPA: hypothetical protein VFO55_02640 [Gemmatimonadaceae bacterium]|nr:hypothetical protein [Gemmatimonadaceae bacterium]